MTEILARIDQIIAACAKRDLIPSVEVIDALLDLRNIVEVDNDPVPA